MGLWTTPWAQAPPTSATPKAFNCLCRGCGGPPPGTSPTAPSGITPLVPRMVPLQDSPVPPAQGLDILGSALTVQCLAVTWGSVLSGSSVQGHLSTSMGREHLFLFCQLPSSPRAPPIPVVTVCSEMMGENGVAAYSQSHPLAWGIWSID